MKIENKQNKFFCNIEFINVVSEIININDNVCIISKIFFMIFTFISQQFISQTLFAM